MTDPQRHRPGKPSAFYKERLRGSTEIPFLIYILVTSVPAEFHICNTPCSPKNSLLGISNTTSLDLKGSQSFKQSQWWWLLPTLSIPMATPKWALNIRTEHNESTSPYWGFTHQCLLDPRCERYSHPHFFQFILIMASPPSSFSTSSPSMHQLNSMASFPLFRR